MFKHFQQAMKRQLAHGMKNKDIIESKKDEELQTKSVDELKDMINDM